MPRASCDSEPSLRTVHAPPHGGGPYPGKIARGHQQLSFISFQRLGRHSRFVRFWPPYESPFRQSFLCKPVSLAVVAEKPDCRPAAASKYEHTAGERIFGELFLAEPYEGVNTFSSIDRLNRYQHAHLRGDLDHPCISCQARSRLVQSGGTDAFHWMRTLPPAGD